MIEVYERHAIFVISPAVTDIYANIEILRKLPFEVAAYFFVGISLPDHIHLLF
jgi:hypothetical protein